MSEISLIKLLKEEVRYINRVYTDPSITLTVYRTLSSISKHFLNMLLIGVSIPRKGFIRLNNKLTDDTRFDKIDAWELRVFVEEESKGSSSGQPSESKYIASKDFDATLISIFTNKYESKFVETTLESKQSFEKIMNESLEKWRRMIHQSIVRPNSSQRSDLQRILELGPLIIRRDNDWEITSDGFQFVLNNTKYQINAFIYLYAKFLIKERKRNPIAVFSTLCALNMCLSEVKSKSDMIEQYTYYAYKVKENSEDVKEQREIIGELFTFGLLYKESKESDVFIITPLFANFLFEKTHTYNTESNLNMIVETNFKIYAYTNSQLHIDLLTHFAKINYRLPNLTVATLTQNSVKRAFQKKIKREQIVNFLNKNIHSVQKAHAEKEALIDKEHKQHIHDKENQIIRADDILEKIKKDGMYSSEGANLIPENVDQQLRMWENDKDIIFEENDDSDRD